MKQSIAYWFRRLLRRPWTPFDSKGNLRPELFTHEGWTRVGAITEDISPQQSSSLTIPKYQTGDPIYICVASARAPWWRRLLRRFGR